MKHVEPTELIKQIRLAIRNIIIITRMPEQDATKMILDIVEKQYRTSKTTWERKDE